ncbi:pseudouridine synthase [uncultured Methylobacterium sp.]|uniref:pseudouridine synthase n=1 Tax=uncultured Methylobacterium sp. TaxID=157278 RepID=UPI00260FC7FA|nr:pseudouridine synthase [uncultured Methylobacterium sp.]
MPPVTPPAATRAPAPPQASEARRGAPTGDAVLRRPAKPAASSAKPAASPGKPAASSGKPGASREAPAEPAAESERIAKVIARAGIASRRDAEAMILEGRVTLNGKRLDSPAMNVGPDDRITVDGEALPARERTRLWLLHKPRGVVTTARDPEGRPTVFDGLPEDLPRVVTIGRLDINTEGLLLLTNDGGLAKVIAHPETGWLRRYRVRAFGDVDQAALDRLRGGVTIDGMEYGPVEATIDRQQGDNVWLTFGLREGKNREVKRILEHLGLSVNRLIRLSFGPFQLGDLEVGLVDEVRTKVLREQLGRTLAEQAGVDFESPVREPIAPFGSPKPAAQPERGARPPREGGRDTGGREMGRGPARGGRDQARPQASRTQAARPNAPQRRVWRDEEAEGEPPQRPRIPRRGADPQQARAASAERPRERVGAIASGERRVVVERLVAPPQEEAAPHRRTRFRSPDGEGGEGRPPRRPRDEGGSRERGAGTGGKRSYGGRSGGETESREFRGAPRGAGKGAPKGPFRRDDARGGDERPSRGFRQDGGGQGGPRKGAGGRSFEGKSFEGRSSGGKSFGGKSSGGGKSFGDKSFGGKPGGGGRPGGKPGGFKSGGGRPGGGSRGGRPGGARPPRG